MAIHWLDYRNVLQNRYGESVYRLGVDGGFSCPNRARDRSGGCIYCDRRGSSAVYQRRSESQYFRNSPFMADIDAVAPFHEPLGLEERKASILQQIAHGREFLDKRYKDGGRSMYFQAFTNTYDTPRVLKELYDCALATGDYREFIVSTRPDCVGPEVVGLLASYTDRVETVWVELGLQSGNDDTLKRIHRGHSVDDFCDACHRLHAAGISVCAHVILGLPGETYAHIGRTAAVITQVHPQALKIHNLHVTAGSMLYDEFLTGGLAVSSMDRHMSETIHLLRRIPADIPIQRFVSDTPSHRLAAPRHFGDKGVFLKRLEETMERMHAYQGDLL